MAWVKVKWIPQLFMAFNREWPNRTRAQDGTIGDVDHQTSASGHNPDDTPGSLAERSDADSIAEVRAADVDSRGVPMQAVIDGILSAPGERARFIYIIFNGYIWRASNGWHREAYAGSDKHLTHAHFSGHPDFDEDARPFITITGGTAMTTLDSIHDPAWNEPPNGDGDPRSVARLIWETWDTMHTTYSNTAAKFPNSIPAALKRMEARQVAMAAVIESLAAAIAAGGGNVETAVILEAMDTKLEALAAEQRDAVADLGEGGSAQVRADA